MNAKNIFLGAIILAMGLSGCGPSADNDESFGSNAPRAWFDAPLPETVYPPNPCQIVAHGASPNGIAVFELYINGTAVSVPSPDTQASLVTLNRDCALTEPGRYVLYLRAQDNSGAWSGYAETSLIIATGNEPLASPPPAEAVATVTLQPTLTPVIGPADELSITSVSTYVVYVGSSSCGPLETSITARAVASKGITAVVLFFRFPSTDFQSVSMSPLGNDLYQGTINMASLFGNSIPFDQSILEYQVVVQQSDGDTSLRTPLFSDIAAQACGPVDDSGSTDACSVYTDQRTCIAKGCNWWEIPGTVPSFVCKSKP
jgi:hypothetical protein